MLETILSSIITSSIVAVIIQTFLKNGIQNFYNQKLVTFKDDLNRHAELRRLDFDRKIHDFSLYSTKRHELYPQMYKRIYKVHSDMSKVDILATIKADSIESPDQIIPYYEQVNIDLTEELKKNLDTLSLQWNAEPIRCSALITELVKEFLYNKVSTDINESNDFFMENSLYFSDEIASKIDKILRILSLFLLQKKGKRVIKEDIDKNKIDNDIDSLKEMFKKELKVGDYNENH